MHTEDRAEHVEHGRSIGVVGCRVDDRFEASINWCTLAGKVREGDDREPLSVGFPISTGMIMATILP